MLSAAVPHVRRLPIPRSAFARGCLLRHTAPMLLCSTTHRPCARFECELKPMWQKPNLALLGLAPVLNRPASVSRLEDGRVSKRAGTVGRSMGLNSNRLSSPSCFPMSTSKEPSIELPWPRLQHLSPQHSPLPPPAICHLSAFHTPRTSDRGIRTAERLLYCGMDLAATRKAISWTTSPCCTLRVSVRGGGRWPMSSTYPLVERLGHTAVQGLFASLPPDDTELTYRQQCFTDDGLHRRTLCIPCHCSRHLDDWTILHRRRKLGCGPAGLDRRVALDGLGSVLPSFCTARPAATKRLVAHHHASRFKCDGSLQPSTQNDSD